MLKSQDYVTAEYIGTPGCFSSPGLCGRLLNRETVYLRADADKPADNMGEETLTCEGARPSRDQADSTSAQVTVTCNAPSYSTGKGSP